MKLFSQTLLSSLALSSALLACSGVPEKTDDQAAANTTDGGADASAADCANLASGPFQPQSIGQPFSGSEDFAFDGQGSIVGKKGNSVVRVNAAGTTTVAALPGQVYGLRYHPNGNLIAALPGSGKVVSVSPSGQVTDLLTGLGQPNGVYVDFAGNAWITEFSGNKVLKLADNGTKTVLVSGTANAQGANGVVLDAAKGILFYTEYPKGKVQRLKVSEPNPTPSLVATISGAALDGLVLDACGNVYAVDQGSSRIFRVRIDADGNAAAQPELLARFPTNVANAQFGSGPGYDPKTLYVTGNPGTVYALNLGVAGAAVATPAAPTH